MDQIAGLLKDNEKIQATPEVPPSDDDTEIKKIKKVSSEDERSGGKKTSHFLHKWCFFPNACRNQYSFI